MQNGTSHFAIQPGNAAWYLYVDSDTFTPTPFEVVPSIIACRTDLSYKMYAGTDLAHGTGNLDSESGVFWRVDGVAPSRVLTFEWDGNYGYFGAPPYLESGAIHFRVKLFEAAGGPDFVIAWGAMARDNSPYPGYYDDWSLVTVGSATRFNDVYPMNEHDRHLQQKANHSWSFVW